MSKPTDVLTPSFIALATRAVLDTGAFLVAERKNFNRAAVEIKGTNELVSYVDRTAEERLQAVFNELTPECGYINEESGSSGADRDFVWIIDPLDGTTNYIFDIPFYSVSVALQFQGETVAGWVYAPVQNELFFAQKGAGATLDGRQIKVSDTTRLEEGLLATGFPYSKFEQDTHDYLQTLYEFMKKSRGIRRIGSAAMDLAYVAVGRFDAFFEASLNPWDVAAGALIVREAGGKVTDYHGGEHFLFGETIIASNGALHDDIQHIILKYAG